MIKKKHNGINILLFTSIACLVLISDVYGGRMDDSFKELDCIDEETFEVECKEPLAERRVEPPQKERIIVIEKIVPIAIPVRAPSRPKTPPSPEPLPSARPNNPTEVGAGIAFELEECRKRGNEIECHFNITSRFFDRSIVFGRYYGKNIFLYDNIGNQYQCYTMKLAGKEGRETSGTLHSLKTQLIADTTTSATFYFKNISTQASSIAKLEINSEANKSGSKDSFTLKFRELAFITE